MRGVYLSLSTIVVTIYFSLIARNSPLFFVIARSASALSLYGVLLFCHCTECSLSFVIARSAVRHDEAISPTSSLRGRTQVLPKQSLFSRIFGIPTRLRLNYQRLPRALSGPHNDRGGDAYTSGLEDCHVASLLAMTVEGVALAMTTHGHVRHTAPLFCVKSFLFCSYPGMNRNVSQFFWGFERIPLFPVNFYLFTIPIGSCTRIISFQKYVIYFFYIPSP